MEEKKNLFLPGNLRYQPKQLMDYFGYDNLYRALAEVEIATLQVLGELRIIPPDDLLELTSENINRLLAIPTTGVDKVEREITHHDVRAWIRMAQKILRNRLFKWIHVPLTSYDPLDTGRILQFFRAYQKALRPAIQELVLEFCQVADKFSGTLQIGRTHGQHALPITVGFWIATVLQRIVYNWKQMDFYAQGLCGKISGAVGAYNAQRGLGIDTGKSNPTFEMRVLAKLGLQPAKISTQILPPEPLGYFLFSCVMLSATLAQFGRDCRHLMRSEIGEIVESFEDGQVGSSTMAHKRNPINFENLEGMYLRTKNEFGKVLDTLISEHQRDLVGSSVARDFPIILINLQQQLNTLLRKNKSGIPFIRRISVNEDACRRNFSMSAHLILAEPLYIALQMAGYLGDAHELVNHKLVPIAQQEKRLLVSVLEEIAVNDTSLQAVIKNIPEDVWNLLHHPENYTGLVYTKIANVKVWTIQEMKRMSE